jgi:hypothetical protein
MSSTVVDALDTMRKKVNTAKHDPGLLVGHFVTQVEYDEAVQAISALWEGLDAQETFLA